MFEIFERSSLSLSICLLFFVYCCYSTPQRNELLNENTGIDPASIQKLTPRMGYRESSITFPEELEKGTVVEPEITTASQGNVIFRPFRRWGTQETRTLVTPTAPVTPTLVTATTPETPTLVTATTPETPTLVTPKATLTVGKSNSRNFKRTLDIIDKKCQEYAEYRFIKTTLPALLPDSVAREEVEYDCHVASPAVVNGKNAALQEFPHMAVIGYFNSNNQTKWNCGGSLISDRFILSAAHCNRDVSGFAKVAMLGELNIESKTRNDYRQIYNIIERILHPDYKSPQLDNDIMLFKLDTVVEFNSYVRPICLATSPLSTYKERNLVISGWGYADTVIRNDGILKKAEIKLFENEKCVNAYREATNLRKGFDSTNMICAGNVEKREDACKGDSGGPVQTLKDTCLYMQLGVISYGSNICADLSHPESIHTNVYSYLDWIQSIVWP